MFFGAVTGFYFDKKCSELFFYLGLPASSLANTASETGPGNVLRPFPLRTRSSFPPLFFPFLFSFLLPPLLSLPDPVPYG